MEVLNEKLKSHLSKIIVIRYLAIKNKGVQKIFWGSAESNHKHWHGYKLVVQKEFKQRDYVQPGDEGHPSLTWVI